MKNSPLKTSFRSVTQATDSARRGCRAKMAAESALGHRRRVIRQRTSQSRTAERACSSTLVKWWTAGPGPKRCQTSTCERQVKGAQLSKCSPVNTSQRFRGVKSAVTSRLSNTASPSS